MCARTFGFVFPVAFLALLAKTTPTQTWTTGAMMLTGRFAPAGGAIGNKLYVAGGLVVAPDPCECLKEMEVYDPASNSWKFGASMPTARAQFAIGVIDDQLYAIGGGDCSGWLRTLDIYNAVTNVWTTGPPMPTARGRLAAGVIGGKVYVVGGSGPLGILRTLEIFDPATNTWTTGPPMPIPLHMHAAVGTNGRLYVVGGIDSSAISNALLIFDPMRNEWTTGAPISTRRSIAAAAVLWGELYALGAFGGTVPTNRVEIYDPMRNEWRIGPPMPTARNACVVGAVNGKLYVTGGAAVWAEDLSWKQLDIYTPAPPAWVEMEKAKLFSLLQNEPNPFNARTTLRIGIPETQPVRLEVYDVAGVLTRTLVDGELGVGMHETVWDGCDEKGRDVASGVYICRLTGTRAVETRRMILLR